jgi:multiple antibiotic resistance protein
LISQYNEHPAWEARLAISGVVVILGIIVYLILRSAPLVYRILGEAGLKALSRIMGFIVMSIGVQMMIGGVIQLVEAMSK